MKFIELLSEVAGVEFEYDNLQPLVHQSYRWRGQRRYLYDKSIPQMMCGDGQLSKSLLRSMLKNNPELISYIYSANWGYALIAVRQDVKAVEIHYTERTNRYGRRTLLKFRGMEIDEARRLFNGNQTIVASSVPEGVWQKMAATTMKRELMRDNH